MKLNRIFKIIISIIICELAGIIGSLFTFSEIPTWYATLSKPLLNPPNWVFGPVWTTLYALMGVAVFLIWDKGLNHNNVRKALSIFGIQLILNSLWSIIFFGLHSLVWAFVNIIALWVAIIWTMILFKKISNLAFYLLVPYILWVSFAAYLNFAILMLN